MMIRRFAFAVALVAASIVAVPAVAQQQQQEGPEPEITQHGDWAVVCQPGQQGGPKLCEMVQSVTKQDTQEPVMQLIVAQMPEDNATLLRVMVPIGVLLQEGMRLQIDGSDAADIAYGICTQVACIGDTELNSGMVTRMRRGAGGTLSFVYYTGEVVDVPFSLQGFTASFNAIQR